MAYILMTCFVGLHGPTIVYSEPIRWEAGKVPRLGNSIRTGLDSIDVPDIDYEPVFIM